jgi:hypothetical protein
MAEGKIFPSGPWRIVGVAVIVLVVMAIVNNVDFLGNLTKRRV